MSEQYTPPSTVAGIKRLAKKLKKEHGIQHSEALDRAAGIAGYADFKHAKRVLGEES